MACTRIVASRVRHPLSALLGVLLLCSALALGVPGAQAAENDRFTFVVIPDTQSYVVSDTYHPTFGQQTQWIVDHRAELGVSFVAQLGDLVESHPNVTQWQRASQYMATLDAAGVPNSVIPGNHDMDVVTGEAARYDEYFPVSRYAQASWNSPTASYGGYLGQNLFGPDPVDRKNKDSFSLFTAAGRDFLVLNLEYESPDAVLAWAQKVIDAQASV